MRLKSKNLEVLTMHSKNETSSNEHNNVASTSTSNLSSSSNSNKSSSSSIVNLPIEKSERFKLWQSILKKVTPLLIEQCETKNNNITLETKLENALKESGQQASADDMSILLKIVGSFVLLPQLNARCNRDDFVFSYPSLRNSEDRAIVAKSLNQIISILITEIDKEEDSVVKVLMASAGLLVASLRNIPLLAQLMLEKGASKTEFICSESLIRMAWEHAKTLWFDDTDFLIEYMFNPMFNPEEKIYKEIDPYVVNVLLNAGIKPNYPISEEYLAKEALMLLNNGVKPLLSYNWIIDLLGFGERIKQDYIGKLFSAKPQPSNSRELAQFKLVMAVKLQRLSRVGEVLNGNVWLDFTISSGIAECYVKNMSILDVIVNDMNVYSKEPEISDKHLKRIMDSSEKLIELILPRFLQKKSEATYKSHLQNFIMQLIFPNIDNPKYRAMTAVSLKVIKSILEHGFSPNFYLKVGESKLATPLHIAIEQNNEKLVSLLIEYNANVELPCYLKYGSETITPLKIAEKSNMPRIEQLLNEKIMEIKQKRLNRGLARSELTENNTMKLNVIRNNNHIVSSSSSSHSHQSKTNNIFNKNANNPLQLYQEAIKKYKEKDYEGALSNAVKARDLFIEKKVKPEACLKCESTIVSCHRELRQYSMAIFKANSAIQSFSEQGLDVSAIVKKHHQCLKLKKVELKSVYDDSTKLIKDKKYHLAIYKLDYIMKKNIAPELLAYCHFRLVSCYQGLGKIHEAYENCKKALKLFNKHMPTDQDLIDKTKNKLDELQKSKASCLSLTSNLK